MIPADPIPPEEIAGMAQLRVRIDNLDRRLVALLAERARLIDRAGELKPAEGLPARIDSRIAAVLANVRAAAAEDGLDPELAEKLWRELIEWSIAREERVLGRHDAA